MMIELPNSSVTFQTSHTLVQKLFDEAENKCRINRKDFLGRTVLLEGGGYEKIFLETQPMGGEMYAKRDLRVGLNNQLLFMEYQRADGRMPGSIMRRDGRLIPEFNKLSGFCFPAPALNLYYLTGRDPDYLNLLGSVLERFDAYLWRTHDTDGDGCLESWCTFDTGEDHAVRYEDAPEPWSEEHPPAGCRIVPMASMDVMSFSFSARDILSRICRIRGDEKAEELWRRKAEEVRAKIRTYLWDEAKGACFDRDKEHRPLPAMLHNNLRLMYWGSISPDMAHRFVTEHLLNPQEFWTPMPLPSVAVNDPQFRNIPTNNWSGQPQALTYQRAIRALENYGYDDLIPYLGWKLMEAIGERCVFVQQYDPFTAQPSAVALEGEQDAYGPAMLAVLEYISRIYGVHREGETLYWGTYGHGEGLYAQEWGDDTFRLVQDDSHAEAYINERQIFSAPKNCKILTDLKGNILRISSGSL